MDKFAFRSIVALFIVIGATLAFDLGLLFTRGEYRTEATWESPDATYTEGMIKVGEITPRIFGEIPYRTLIGNFTTMDGDTITSVVENGYGRLNFGTSDGRGIWELEDQWVISPDGETETALTEAEIVQWKAYANQWFKTAKTGVSHQKSFYCHGLFS